MLSLTPLERWLADRLAGETRAWYERALVAARRAGVAGDEFLIAWSGCGRRLGRSTLTVAPVEAETLAGRGRVVRARGVGDGRGRAGPAAAGGGRREARRHMIADGVADLFAKGEMREQQAVLRVLAHLPEPERYAWLAADAVRTNVLSVLEALALR